MLFLPRPLPPRLRCLLLLRGRSSLSLFFCGGGHCINNESNLSFALPLASFLEREKGESDGGLGFEWEFLFEDEPRKKTRAGLVKRLRQLFGLGAAKSCRVFSSSSVF